MNGKSRNRLPHRLAAASAFAAALSLATVPAAAAELPRPHGPASAQAYDENANTAEHRRWRRHHDGIDGGDILAGVLILGGIAAVAGAIESNNRADDYRGAPPPPPPSRGRYGYRAGMPQGASSGLDRAADICADAIERTMDPVGGIDAVRRGPSGWNVDGTLRDGTPFSCEIGNNGEIRDIQLDRGYRGAGYTGSAPSYGNPPYQAPRYDGPDYDNPSYNDPSYDDPSYDDGGYDDQSRDDNQWDDETYARLREHRDGTGG